ncbi:hypothetical protein [Acidithiobacillus caldus]|uniref:hypothetical protein n=1 Tax=Acidithiobacillus caldus TaxID=33059 RepID=UPI001C067F52|nr:hypothetical protein [Acidithiobacillus caldus]MBU2770132.1 hypothetical protein [Acidithiobacillus caldus]
MTSMTLRSAIEFCQPEPGNAGLEKRKEYAAWLKNGGDMAHVPTLVRELSRKIECSIVHATHVMRAFYSGKAEEMLARNESVSVADLPIYSMVEEFFQQKLHAKDGSGQAWSGALYGRKLRGKKAYKAGLADEIGEYPALIAFFCLLNGLKGIQKIRQMTGIAWGTLKEWIAAAIGHINLFRKKYLSSVLAMKAIRAKDFCLGIFARNKTNSKVTTCNSKGIEDNADEADPEFDDDGGYDDGDEDNSNRGRGRGRGDDGKKTEREVMAEIVALDVSHFSKIKARNQAETRMQAAVLAIDKSMLLAALRTPENAADFFSLLWQWAEQRSERLPEYVFKYEHTRAIQYIVNGVQNDFLTRDGDGLGEEIDKIWRDVVDERGKVLYLHRPISNVKTKKMRYNLETGGFVNVLADPPDAEIVKYFLENSFWQTSRGKKHDPLKKISGGRFIIRRSGEYEAISCQYHFHPRKASRLIGQRDIGKDNDGNAIWDIPADFRDATEPEYVNFDNVPMELKRLEFNDYQRLGNLIGLPPAVIRGGLAGDDEKYQALLLAIQNLSPDRQAEAQEAVMAMLMPEDIC